MTTGNLLSAAWINRRILELDSSRRSLITVPMCHHYGLIQLYSHAMAKSSRTLGESGQFHRSAFEAITSQAIADLVLVPFTPKALLDYSQNSKRDQYQQAWRRIAYLASSSDQLSPDLLRRACALSPGRAVVNVYGLTEAGRAC
jgi:acyl-CoA synthetase (AMP-forming)/AMP-acid ligase II